MRMPSAKLLGGLVNRIVNIYQKDLEKLRSSCVQAQISNLEGMGCKKKKQKTELPFISCLP